MAGPAGGAPVSFTYGKGGGGGGYILHNTVCMSLHWTQRRTCESVYLAVLIYLYEYYLTWNLNRKDMISTMLSGQTPHDGHDILAKSDLKGRKIIIHLLSSAVQVSTTRSSPILERKSSLRVGLFSV